MRSSLSDLFESCAYNNMLERVNGFKMVDFYPYNVKYVSDSEEKDVYTKIIVEFAFAGFTKNDISVQFKNNAEMLVSVTKHDEDENDKCVFAHKGISSKSNELRFKITSDIDVEKHKCFFKNGILTIELPLKEDYVVNAKIS